MNKLGSPRKAPVPLEHDEQAQFMLWLKTHHPAMWLHTFAALNGALLGGRGRKGRAQLMAKYKREGFKVGVPDLICLWPMNGYPGMMIEFKRQNMVPSDISTDQQEWADRLVAAGYFHVFANGNKAAQTAVKMYLEGEK